MAVSDISASAPMATPLLRRLTQQFEYIRQRLEKRRDLKQARAAFLNVAHLDDRLLEDIGVTREEVQWAASLPLEMNAALELKKLADSRLLAMRSVSHRGGRHCS